MFGLDVVAEVCVMSKMIHTAQKINTDGVKLQVRNHFKFSKDPMLGLFIVPGSHGQPFGSMNVIAGSTVCVQSPHQSVHSFHFGPFLTKDSSFMTLKTSALTYF